ncbi:MAG: hypothetical protein K9W46_07250 [Candidatus Heimdallarchaeum endolithica]|uniref:Uncharacterized protein n=1 Tax=Candidatus Heimdallarchaeum endolithica TaxID=2876572 RepID=A0A9Y1BNL4_9ARCH|nr:MAG: hypothetical protein K9W46_07250 [Candidatus Heimdallarchaeum endolithica]
MKKKLFNLILLSTLLIISSFSILNTKAETDTIAVLTLKVSGSGYLPDYGLYIAQYLDKLGIKVNIKNEEWIVFIGTLTITYDFDLAFLGLTGGGTIYDQKELFCENGSLNYFGINTEIPYGDDNERC